jgi:hypothetical protein
VNAFARLFLVVCAVVAGDAFAADQSGGEARQPPSHTANVAGKKVLVDDTVNDAQLKQILARGYKPDSQARGNEVYYCRRQRETGSRFETKVCKTAARILQDELNGKDATGRLEQTSGNKALK